MSKDSNNWTTFKKRVTIKSSRSKIYKALASREGIESWFLRKAEFFSKESDLPRSREEFIAGGDVYSWFWFGWSDEVNQKGSILETIKNDSIKFTFHDPMIVTIKILHEEGENLVELKQVNIPTDEDSKTNYYVGCGEGWTFYLANLKSVLEGGLDLRNKNEKIEKVINS